MSKAHTKATTIETAYVNPPLTEDQSRAAFERAVVRENPGVTSAKVSDDGTMVFMTRRNR